MSSPTIESIETSKDNTIKLMFKEGFHCVLIPLKNNKTTLCISSQVGCAMGCEFCLTAKMGFIRNLTQGEIVAQFEESFNYLKEYSKQNQIYAHQHITSIVFMGMGEPFNNYTNVISSIKFLNSKYSYPYKKITISTSGILPKMKEYVNTNFPSHLAISFHSAIQEKRDILMPYLKPFPITDLVEVCNEYSRQRKAGMMIEYIMIEHFTDLEEDLNALLQIDFEQNINFNLIPLNGSMKINDITYYASSMKRCEEFKQALRDKGYKCFIRFNMGEDIEAACGMLSEGRE
ncbi:MAG: radical SAM protein [Nanoarchaeota archaeon]|nr:radical SAM protein [Nanoarchaeota archaeon]